MAIRRNLIIVLSVILVGLLVVFFLLGDAQTSSGDLAIPKTELTVIEAMDQTESMAHPAFITEAYDFIEIEGDNIALEAVIEATSFTQSYTARKANDGDTSGASYWEGEADTYPCGLTLNFETTVTPHAIRLQLNPASVWGKRLQSYYIEYSVDGESYTTLFEETSYAFDPDYGNEVVLTFDAVSMQYLRIMFTENTGASAGQLAEISVYELN